MAYSRSNYQDYLAGIGTFGEKEQLGRKLVMCRSTRGNQTWEGGDSIDKEQDHYYVAEEAS